MCWCGSYWRVSEGTFAEYFKSVLDGDEMVLIDDIEGATND